MVGVACDVFLSSGEDRFVQVLVEGNGGAIPVFQRSAQLLSQGGDLQLTRFSGQVRVLNSTAYTCRLTYVTTSGSSPAIRSSPIFVTALNICKSSLITLSCLTAIFPSPRLSIDGVLGSPAYNCWCRCKHVTMHSSFSRTPQILQLQNTA